MRLYLLCSSQVECEEGTVKWFNSAKGFGYITLPDGSDVYVQYTNLLVDGFQDLREGEEVSFDVINGSHGPEAINVRRAF